MKPPTKNHIGIAVDPTVTKGNKLRFTVTITTPEGYEFKIKGALAGARETGEQFAQAFYNYSRPVRWNDKFEDDVLELLNKRGAFKRLAPKVVFAGEKGAEFTL